MESRKLWLMKELWKLSEECRESGNESDAVMLEAAGNMVENTFCVGKPADLILDAAVAALEG